MEQLNVKLDGSEIVKGVNDAVTALAELQAAFRELVANSPTGQLRAQFQAVATQAQLVTETVGKVMGQVSTSVAKGLQDAEKTAKTGGKRVAQAMAAGLEDGDVVTNTVRAQRARLQAEYESMVNMGAKVKLQALQNLRTMGVSLFPDDRARLDQAKKLNSDFTKLYQADAASRAAAAKDAASEEVKAQLAASKANEKVLADDLVMYRNMLRLRVQAEQEAQAQIAMLRLNGLAGTAKAQVNLATRAPEGIYSSLARSNFGAVVDTAAETQAFKANAEAVALAAQAKNAARESSAALSAQAKITAQEQKALAARSNEVHAAFRGVAGAGGALFLTYGSLLPLTTAFFATAAIRDSIQDYKDFEYQLKFVQAVADDSTVSLDKMRESVTASARAIGADPIEAAKGLRILAQSGLSTQEALNALPDILNLSTVGELGMAKAAEVATGAVNAFGLGVDNIGHVVDVFYKSAAISNTSVESISESMKQASTIAQRYKLSVEDVGVALVALAKRNIVGSSAGTSLTQMFNELATPHGAGKKIASQLGITLFDPIKNDTKDFFEKFVPQLREKLKQFDPQSQTYILNELTNNRGAKALSAILGLSDEELAQLKIKLNDATGSAARAVVEMNDSIQGDLNKLKSAFKDTLQGAGAEGADSLRKSIQNLQEVIQSKAVQEALSGLISGVANLLQLVTSVADAWASWTFVRNALSQVLNPLENVARVLGLIHDKQGDKAANDDALGYVDNTIRKEHEYQRSLEDSIAKLKEKLGLQGATAKAAATDIAAQLVAAERKMVLAQQDYNSASGGGKTVFRDGAADALQKLNDARSEFNRLASAQAALADAQKQTQRERAEQAALQAQAAALAAPKTETGTKHLNIPDPGAQAAARAAAESYQRELNRQIDLEAAARKQQYAGEEEDARHQEAMLKDSYQRGTIGYAAYQAQLEAIQSAATARRIQELQTEENALIAEGPKLQAAFDRAKAAGSHTDEQKAANEQEANRQKVAALSLQISRLGNQEEERRSDALTKTLSPSTELVKNSAKELELQKLNVEQELKKLAIKNNGATLSEKDAYVQAEVLRISNAQVDTVKKYETALNQLQASGALDEPTPDSTAAWLNLVGLISRAKANLANTQQEVSAAAAEAFDAKKVDDYAKSLNNDLTSALINAGHDGGEGLWKELQDELIKKPLTVALKGLLQPVSQGIAQFVMGQGSSSGGGGNNTLGTIGNVYSAYNGASSVYSLGSQYMNGTMSGTNALGTMYANSSSTGLDGLLSTNGAYGTGGAGMGTMAAGAGFFAVLAKVLISEYQADKGDTRAGANFGYTPGAVSVSNPTGVNIYDQASGARPDGSDDTVKALIAGTSTQINDALKSFGTNLTVGAFQAGWEASVGGNPNGNGRGGVFSGGALSNGAAFGETGKGSNYDFTGPLDSKYELSGTNLAQRLLGATGAPIDFNGSPDKLATDAQQAYLEALQSYAGITPRIVAQKATAGQVGHFGDSDNSGFLGGLTSNIREGDTIGWVRVFDQQMKDSARALGALPKRIMDLIIDVDPEALSKEASLDLSTKISTMVANVNAFHAAVDEMPFGKLKDLSFDAAAGLVELAGGVDKLTAGLSSYYENFYSDSEKRQNVAQQIQKQLSGVGLDIDIDKILHGTREQFRKLVEVFQGDGTDAGEKVYATLLGVSEAFASITQQAASATDALNDQVKSLQDASSSFRGFEESLKKFQVDLNGPLAQLSPEARYQQARTSLDQLLALAPDNQQRLQGLEGAGREYLAASQAYNATGGAYGSDLEYVKAAVDSSVNAAGAAADLADQQLQVAQQQLDALNGIQSNTSTTNTGIVDLNALVTAVNTGQFATWEANYNTQVALAQAAAAAQYANTQNTIAAINTTTQVTAALGGSGFSLNGGSLEQNDAGVQPGGGTAGSGSGSGFSWSQIPQFDSGTDYVPHDMLAFIHGGERITPAWDNPKANPYTSTSGDLGPVVAAVTRLEDRLNQLIQVTAAAGRGTIEGLGQVVDNTATSARASALRSSAAPV